MTSDTSKQGSSALGLRLSLMLATAGIVMGLVVVWIAYLQFHPYLPMNSGVDVDLKSLGNFQLQPFTATVADIPLQFRSLEGKKVTLEGFAYVGFSSEITHTFQLVYNISPGNHQGPPLVQERVIVSVAKGIALNEIPTDKIKVVGIFHVRLQRDQTGRIVQVYELDLDHMEPL